MTYLTKEYFSESGKAKHALTWLLGLLLIGPFLCTDDLVVMFISLIGFSLAVYTMIISDNKRHVAREAAIKYFYLSAISVTLILFGITINYLIFETTNYEATEKCIKWLFHYGYFPPELMMMMLAFLSFGFFFKLAAYPGHLWAADVYEGSPKPAFAFFVLPSKVIVLIVFIKLMTDVYGELHGLWEPLLTIACVGSLVWGGLAAVYERKIKRFVAYTSINQIGFLLIGLVSNVPGSDNYKYTLVYLVVYTIMTLNLLIVYLQTYPAIIYITDVNPFHKYNPFMGMVLVFTMFAMAGIPPLAGFWGKYYLLVAAFKANYVFIVKVALAISMISTFYYIRIVKIMLFEKLNLPKVYVSKPTLVFLLIVNVLLITFVCFTDIIV